MLATDTERRADAPAARRALLEALYGGADPSLYFVIWTLEGRDAFPFKVDEIDAALDKIDTLDDGAHNIFCSMYLLGDRPATGRGEKADVCAVVALWADLDVKDQPGFPPTRDDALAIARAVPVPVSMLVNSGGGAHAYWFLKEPIADDIEVLLAAWKATVREYAKQTGWKVDSVYDSTRMMRVVGTLNCKPDQPVRPSSIIEHHADRQYALGDIEPYLMDPEDLWEGGRPSPVPLGGVDLVPIDILPPQVRVAIEENPRFRKTWQMKRGADLNDHTPSGYCLSLATFLARMGLTDRQVAQLICLWREENKAGPKGQKWYERTLGLARQDAKLGSGNAEGLESITAAGEGVDRAARLRALSETIGLPIDAIQRFDRKKPIYKLVSLGRGYDLGEARVILNQREFANAIGVFHRVMPTFQTSVWKKVAQALFDATEDVDTGDDATEAGQGRHWLSSYLAGHTPQEIGPADAWDGKKPYLKDGMTIVYQAAVYDHIYTSMHGPKPSEKTDVGAALLAAGCIKMKPGPQAHRVRRTAFIVPPDMTRGEE